MGCTFHRQADFIVVSISPYHSHIMPKAAGRPIPRFNTSHPQSRLSTTICMLPNTLGQTVLAMKSTISTVAYPARDASPSQVRAYLVYCLMASHDTPMELANGNKNEAVRSMVKHRNRSSRDSDGLWGPRSLRLSTKIIKIALREGLTPAGFEGTKPCHLADDIQAYCSCFSPWPCTSCTTGVGN